MPTAGAEGTDSLRDWRFWTEQWNQMEELGWDGMRLSTGNA